MSISHLELLASLSQDRNEREDWPPVALPEWWFDPSPRPIGVAPNPEGFFDMICNILTWLGDSSPLMNLILFRWLMIVTPDS